ncbi:MAG: hypothetical protein WA418_02070 [Bradyrhizobium sp.]
MVRAVAVRRVACRESPHAIRKKATIPERSNAHDGVCSENFFVAKIYDSESARHARRVSLRIATRMPPLSPCLAAVQEMLAA